jgi:hypothetical protein
MPFVEVFVFWMLWVGHGLKELFVSRKATNVFRRASAKDIGQAGI